jgi:hypothetical protein
MLRREKGFEREPALGEGQIGQTAAVRPDQQVEGDVDGGVLGGQLVDQLAAGCRRSCNASNDRRRSTGMMISPSSTNWRALSPATAAATSGK